MDEKQVPTSSAMDASPYSAKMKTYHLYYTTSRTNARLHLDSASGPCVYYARSCIFTKTGHFQLRAGDNKEAPIVASIKGEWSLHNVLLGFGDYKQDHEEGLVWEQMRREQNPFKCSDYLFGSSFESPVGGRKYYRWRKDTTKPAKTVYTCVDDEGKTMARLLSGGMLNWQKGGEIEVVDNLEKRVEELFLISGLGVWIEEAHRSVRQGFDGKPEAVGQDAGVVTSA
ncbi:MAG: hypothetical protein M1814_001080 [Vezdaea aestivalis]|nr:MAG: hypothetical protein M1814_001080 [Vezdaea aestivalis]